MAIGRRWLVFLALPFFLSARPAWAEAPLRVVVWVGAPVDRAVLERVRGQANDVALELLETVGSRPEPGLDRSWSSAEQHAARQDARVVVWFQPKEDGALLIHFFVPAIGRLLVRSVAMGKGDRSSALEEAAIIVRSTLQALAAGGTLGVTPPEPSGEPPAREAPSAPQSAPSPAPPPEPSRPPDRARSEPPSRAPAPPSNRRRTAIIAAAGWELGMNGFAPHHGVAGRVGVGFPAFEAGIGASFGFPTEQETPGTGVRLTQERLVAYVGLPWTLGRSVRVCACLSAGAVVYRRETLRVAAPVEPQPSSTLISPATGLELRATYRVAVGSGTFVGIGLTAGADAVIAPPDLVVRYGQDAVRKWGVGHVDGRGGVSLEVAAPFLR